jgi:hypothetical protein
MTIFSSQGIGQIGCEMPWQPPPDLIAGACGQTINYAPLVPEHTPVKTIRIAFHCFQNDDGTGNFQENDAVHSAYLQGAVNSINQMLAGLGPLNIGNSAFISDSRVRIEMVAVYSHRNSAHMSVPNASAQYQMYVMNDASGYGLSLSDMTEVEHILLIGANGPTDCCAGRASAFGEQGWIVLNGWYGHYLQYGATSYNWAIPGHFIHELGHALILRHNYIGIYGGCDPCQDNDAVPGGPCPIIGTSNNYMDVTAGNPALPNGYNASNPNPVYRPVNSVWCTTRSMETLGPSGELLKRIIV